MAKISAHVGFTYQVEGTSNFVKIHSTISELDTDLPAEDQIVQMKGVDKTMSAAFKYLWLKIDNEMKKLNEMAIS